MKVIIIKLTGHNGRGNPVAMKAQNLKSQAPLPQLFGHRHHEIFDADYCKTVVRNLGLKVTQQRLVILEDILNGRDHVTAQDVFESVGKKHPDIGFATVYRFLRTLTEQGYTTELRMRGLPARYEWAKKQHHDHMTCLSCGLICEFENDEIETLQKKVAEQLGFKLSDHVLELYGTCGRCQKVSASSVGVVGSAGVDSKKQNSPEIVPVRAVAEAPV